MRRMCPTIGRYGAAFNFAAVVVFLIQPAHSQTLRIALLLQQTPAHGGIVSPQIGVHHFEADSEITLIAVPRSGYQFVYWLGDVVDPRANKTIAYINKPKIIIAVFQQVEHDQLAAGQAPRRSGGGGGLFASSPIISAAAPRNGGTSGGGGAGGGSPTRRTEGDYLNPPDGPPDGPPKNPFDPPDDPFDPPDEPTVPEPATGILLTLGGLALLRKRRAK